MTKLLLAGCGNMGYAMLRAWISEEKLSPANVCIVEPADSLRARAVALGTAAVADPAKMPSGFQPDIVVFAVKPQVMADVVPHYRHFAETGAAFVSIAAGTKIALFEEILGAHSPVIRCMPNTPAAIGKGMMVLVSNGRADPPLLEHINDILSANGRVEWIEDEGLMDAVTAVSGSGPAYVFHFIECLTEAGKAAGLPDGTASTLAMQTVYGAASLAFESGEEPSRLREQVTSPNGTTAAALKVFMDDQELKALVTRAVDAARKRSIELG